MSPSLTPLNAASGAERHRTPRRAAWGDGPVGEAVEAGFRERLLRFIRDEESEPLALFAPAWREYAEAGDWYGEHVGKWLVAAAAAWRRTGSVEVADAIRTAVRFLGSVQEPSGYLGTYASTSPSRFTHPDAAAVRTWDLWVHAWLILGLLRAAEVEGVTDAREAAVRIGDLIVQTFLGSGRCLLDLGNHQGLSSAVLIEPLARLSLATGDPRYAELATRTLSEMEDRGLPLLSAAEGLTDVAEIGTGKAYQLCWILLGLVALHEATGDPRPLRSAEALWQNVADHHLTPLGGPWGGVAGHKEVFNAKGFFSPYGMVETCSTATWMALCRELFLLSGEERYVAEFERSLLNSLLGAADANGHDWCYFTFPNGRRNNTYHWACCKSSGAMALEEASAMIATARESGISVNLLLSSEATLDCQGGAVTVHQNAELGEELRGEVHLTLANDLSFTLALRVPRWARLKAIRINGDSVSTPRVEDGYVRLERRWSDGDRVAYEMECPIAVHPYTYVVDHHGQEVVRMDYAYVSRGPYTYATGPIDGFRKEETLRLARLTPAAPFRRAPSTPGEFGPAIELRLPGRDPIPFLPYAEAGGRHEGAWRTTWLQVAWQ